MKINVFFFILKEALAQMTHFNATYRQSPTKNCTTPHDETTPTYSNRTNRKEQRNERRRHVCNYPCIIQKSTYREPGVRFISPMKGIVKGTRKPARYIPYE